MVIEKQLIVITGAQLNRGTKGEPPTMGNIRESGDIEQDAHNVVILDKDYAKVEKAREGYSASQKMTINTVKQFVFWETSGEYGPTQKDDNKARLIEKRKKLYDNFMPAKSDTEDTLQ
jgi:replicative DNA helicase